MCEKGLEIKEKIDFNNKLIEQLLSPNKFTLNNTVTELLSENKKLQNECQHKFEGGYCIYCYKMEDTNE